MPLGGRRSWEFVETICANSPAHQQGVSEMEHLVNTNAPVSLTDLIRHLNDRLRIHGVGGHIMRTAGVMGLDAERQAAITQAVRTFTDFTEDNDRHREHDFATLTVDGTDLIFKIDYFDKSLNYASTNPADATLTIRVMTIMLASEY
jgi:hypothetical protein